jgi:hypothetical protein
MRLNQCKMGPPIASVTRKLEDNTYLVTWYQTLFKLDINGGTKLQASHKQDFILVSSACKASTKSVAESLNFEFV